MLWGLWGGGGGEVGVDVNEVVMKQYCKLYSKALEKKGFLN